MNKEEKVIPENNCCTGFVQSLDRMHKMRDMAEQLGLHEYVEAFKLGGQKMFWVSIVLRFILLVLSTAALVFCSVYSDGGFVWSMIYIFAAGLNAYSMAINFASLAQCYYKWKYGGSRRYWDE